MVAQLSFTSRRGHRAISLLRSHYLGGSRSRSSSLARVGAPIYASNGAQQWAVQASSSSQRRWRRSSWRHGSAFFPVPSSKFLERIQCGTATAGSRDADKSFAVRKNTVKEIHPPHTRVVVSNRHPILGDGGPYGEKDGNGPAEFPTLDCFGTCCDWLRSSGRLPDSSVACTMEVRC